MDSTMLVVGMGLAGLVVVGIIVALLPAAKAKAPDMGQFAARPLLNRSELAVLAALDGAVGDVFGPGARVFAQVAYGEFLKGSDRGAHARINQKRADFVITDAATRVVCVIEYQGTGHYGKGAAARENAQGRDAVKRAACASAGVVLVEIPSKFTPHSVARQLEDARMQKAGGATT